MPATSLPRPEYPRPQFVRKDWLNLNGKWQFEVDYSDTGKDRGLLTEKRLAEEIIVPFCPESKLSGIGHTDFMQAVWYKKEIKIPMAWKKYPRLRLHFQACDYDTTVWVNGVEVMRHRGGFTPFFAEIGNVVKPGQVASIIVRARDNTRCAMPRGKQSNRYKNFFAVYTRTTGIWQTVWLEPLSETNMERPRITPEVGNRRFHVEVPVTGPKAGLKLVAVLKDKKGEITRAEVPADTDFSAMLDLAIPENRLHLWEPDNPNLYDICFELRDAKGDILDSVDSYAGMRSVVIDGMAVRINGKSVFQRLVLDQGYYVDGIMTAPSDKDLIKDIKLSMEAGFNGARLHQKVFEERFLYHADKMGYLVWGEFGDWGSWNHSEIVQSARAHQPMAAIMMQWQEVLMRDYSHPSIIGWCPLNEVPHQNKDMIETLDDTAYGLYYACKACDRTRPVVDVSGYSHRVIGADVFDYHSYEQNPEKLREMDSGIEINKPFINSGVLIGVPYTGQPYFCSEFGGIGWNPKNEFSPDAWGYGEGRPKSLEEFYTRFEGLCNVLLNNPNMFGYCYTQLTDVFQEQNGLYFFDRSKKFDMKRIRKVQTRPAAIE